MSQSLKRTSKLMFVPFDKIRFRTGISQREFRPAWADKIAQDFRPEAFGIPVVNKIGEWYWMVDGQHRTEGAKIFLGDYKGQKIECQVHFDLSEKEEAALFDRLNNVKTVDAFSKFEVRFHAGYEAETNIDAIVRLHKLKISRARGDGAISCVATLLRIYKKGEDILHRTLNLAYDGFGDSGLDGDILDGTALMVNRYDGAIDDAKAARVFGLTRGGVNAIRNKAERFRREMGVTKVHGIAAAVVEAYNRGKGGKKLPDWWKPID